MIGMVSGFGEGSITANHHIYTKRRRFASRVLYLYLFNFFNPSLSVAPHCSSTSLSLSLYLSLANQSNFLFHQPRSFVEFSDPHLQVRLYVWIQSAVLIVTKARRDRAWGEQQRVVNCLLFSL
jgi:hypothetical protein